MAYPDINYNTGVDTGLSNFKNGSFKAKVYYDLDKKFEPNESSTIVEDNSIKIDNIIEGKELGNKNSQIFIGKVIEINKSNINQEIQYYTILTQDGTNIKLDPDTCKIYIESKEITENYKNILSYNQFLTNYGL